MNDLEADTESQPFQAGGYVFQMERKPELESAGQSPILLANAFGETIPDFNVQADPLEILIKQEDQLQIGACVGNSGTSVVESCYFLVTGRAIQLSRACGYYQAQRKDGLRGDTGATLAGFRAVATEGLCLETDWPYPNQYNNRMPDSALGKFDYKVSSTRPLKTIDEFDFWVREKKLPVHAGFLWNGSSDREYVTNYSSSGMGGHATMFWQMIGDDYRMLNSWGKRWQGKGWNRWSRNAIKQLISSSYSVLVGYAPEAFSFPTPTPIGV